MMRDDVFVVFDSLIVWRREVHVGNEWWFGVVHESDDGKCLMKDINR